MKRLTLTLAALAALGGCQKAPDAGKLYATNVLNDQVTVLDPASGKVIKKIPVGLLPHNMVFTRDYKYLFVTNSGSQNVSVIDTETDTVVRDVLMAPIPKNKHHDKIANIQQFTSCKACHIDPRGDFPMGIALAPKGDDVIVTNFEAGNLVRMGALDFAVREVVPMKYEAQPNAANVIFSPVKDEAYVLNRTMVKVPGKKVPGILTVLDGKLKPKKTVEVIRSPFGMVLNDDGSELFIASRITNKVEIWDTEQWTLKRTLITGDGPVGLFLASGHKLYTGNFYTNRPAYVSVVDTQSGETLKKIEMAGDITRMTTDPGRRYLYVANSGANKITVVDLATDTVIRELAAGAFPVDLVFKPH